MLPALEGMGLSERGAAGLDGVQRLAEGLGASALPAMRWLSLGMHVSDASASALAAALGRGALLRLQRLSLNEAAIGTRAWWPSRRPCGGCLRWKLSLGCNPFGDEGLAALVPPPSPAGAPPTPTGGLTNLEVLCLSLTQVADAGCAALTSALDSGALPSIKTRRARYGIITHGTPASAAAKAALQ